MKEEYGNTGSTLVGVPYNKGWTKAPLGNLCPQKSIKQCCAIVFYVQGSRKLFASYSLKYCSCFTFQLINFNLCGVC
jgi:hypothetical protein